MKKVLVAFAVLSLTVVSCGGLDGEKMGKEYCDCVKKEDPSEMLECEKEWEAKYKEQKVSEKEFEKAQKVMSECMPGLDF